MKPLKKRRLLGSKKLKVVNPVFSKKSSSQGQGLSVSSIEYSGVSDTPTLWNSQECPNYILSLIYNFCYSRHRIDYSLQGIRVYFESHIDTLRKRIYVSRTPGILTGWVYLSNVGTWFGELRALDPEKISEAREILQKQKEVFSK